MRKIIIGLFLLTFGIVISIGLFAQPSASPPAPPENTGSNGNQPPPYSPPGSPIGSGTGILMILAAAYGIKKARDLRKV